jgi:hypothetical protein
MAEHVKAADRNSFQGDSFLVLAKFGNLNALPYHQSVFEANPAVRIRVVV